MTEEIIVGIGMYVVEHNPITLTALGIGSCVVAVLYDDISNICGLAHIMLPDSREYSGKINTDRSMLLLTKYANVAIPKMIDEMVKKGANRNNIKSKISGGAQMFALQSNENLKIGERNIISVKQILKQNNIPIISEDVMGNFGRSIRFDTINKILKIKTANEEKTI